MANKVQEARAFFVNARELVMVENTYMPFRNGVRLSVEKVGASFVDGRVIASPDERLAEGERFRCSIPTRVCDVLAITDDTIKFALGSSSPRLCGHTVEYRKEPTCS